MYVDYLKLTLKLGWNKEMSGEKNSLFIDLWFHPFSRINIDVSEEESFLGTIHCPKTLSALFFECVLNVYL